MRFLQVLTGFSLLASVLPAQITPAHARAWSLAVLGDRIDQRDEVISPAEYGGMLWGARAGYSGEFTAHRTATTLEFRTGSLSGPFANGSHERAWDARLASAYLRPSRIGFVGAELDTRASAYEHRYGSNGFSEDYALILVMLGPVIDWDRSSWRVRATAPLVSLVSRPYSRVNITRGRLPLRFAGPTELRALSVAVSHTTSRQRRVAFRTSYTLDVQSLAQDYGFAAVENGLSAALLYGWGRAR